MKNASMIMMPSAGISVQLAAVVLAAATIQSTLSYDNTQHYYDDSGAIDSGNHKHQQQPEVAVAITDTSQASPSSSWDHSSNNIELLLQKSTSNYSPNIILSSYFPTLEVHSQFTRWKKRHGKNYSTRQEHAHRKWIWLLNHEYIERHNKSTNNTIGENNIVSDGGDTSRKSGYYALAHNDFSDLTLDEFQQRFSLGKYRGMRKGIRKSDESSKESVSIFTTSSSRLQELRRVEEEDEAIMVTRNGLDFVDNVKISSDDSKDGYESTALNNDVMDYKNWVEEGAVTNVKNQLICGA